MVKGNMKTPKLRSLGLFFLTHRQTAKYVLKGLQRGAWPPELCQVAATAQACVEQCDVVFAFLGIKTGWVWVGVGHFLEVK